MKPQLISPDMGGAHNQNITHASSRLMSGGSWKHQRIIVVLPADTMIPAKVALSHWSLVFPPNNGVVRILAQGMEVGEAYSTAVAEILAHPDLSNWEFMLTIEHDNMPPSDGAIELVKQMEAHPEFSAIGGLYFTKGPDGVAQIWGDPKDPVMNYRPQVPVPGALIECNGTGMGFTLFRLSMFKDARLRKPWFKTVAGKEGVGTQDLYFWGDARKYGYRCAIDCNVRVGHLDPVADFVW